MARFKPAGRAKKPAATQRPNAIGCLILLVLAFLAVFGMLYLTFRSA